MDPPVEWELSKENIQPLKAGRKAAALANYGLTDPQRQKDLRDVTQRFEAEIRRSDLADPLAPWDAYVTWIEQAYPKGGPEGNLKLVLEHAIKRFKNESPWNQDARYCHIWIKYANISSAPLEMYNFMWSNRLCTSVPEFYITWAWELESAGNYKKAEKVFAHGRQKVEGEANREELERKYHLFQARVVSRTVAEPEAPEPMASMTEERAVLGSLRGHGKTQKVGSLRVGAAKKSNQPGALATVAPQARANGRPVGFAIHSDENHPVGVSEPLLPQAPETPSENLPFRRDQNRENDLKAGQWGKKGGGLVGRKADAVPLDQIKAKPQFSIHQDDSGTPTGVASTPTTNLHTDTRALSVKKKEEPVIPLAIFEDPDPSKHPMYCKHLVYQGGTEFSFEELRAMKWQRHREEQSNANQALDERKRILEEIEAQRIALKEEQDNFKRLQESSLRQQGERESELKRWQEAVQSQEQFKMTQKEAMERQEREIQLLKETLERQQSEFRRTQGEMMRSLQTNRHAEQKLLENTKNEKPGAGSTSAGFSIFQDSLDKSAPEKRGSTLDDTASLVNADPLGHKRNREAAPRQDESAEKTPTRATHGTLESEDRQTYMPSPTINTKEAFNIMKQMWGKPEKDSPVQKKSKPTFAIYTDENAVVGQPKATPFPIFVEGSTPPSADAFKVCPDEGAAEKTPLSSAAKVRPAFPIFQDPASEESKENVPPQGAQAPPSASLREKTGILQPAKNVPFLPLDDQKEKEEEEERSSFEKMPPPSKPAPNPNMTLALPSQEAFEEMAQRMSTPYHGRPFNPYAGDNDDDDDLLDENTCAVEIVFKKPAEKKKAPSSGNTDEVGLQQPKTDTAPLNPLSPIMETSREHNYKSSTSSSGHSISHQLTKSHWGNTLFQGTVAGASTTLTTTPGAFLLSKSMKRTEMTVSSGYMADNSFARTPGLTLKTPLPAPPQIEEDDEDDDEMTGCVDILAQFKKDAGINSSRMKAPMERSLCSQLNPNASRSMIMGRSFAHESLKEDESIVLAVEKAQGSNLDPSSHLHPPPMESSFKRDDSVFFGSAVADSSHSPQLEVSVRPSLDLSVDASTAPGLDESAPLPQPDESALSQSVQGMDLNAISDPFDESLKRSILNGLALPVRERHGYFRIHGPVPVIRPHREVQIGHNTFMVGPSQGEGSYGKVFKAMKKEDANPNETIADLDVVLKVQKPADEWEFYICSELHARLSQMGASGVHFMQIPRCFNFDDGSVFVSEHQQGTLLDVINAMTHGALAKSMVETVALYYLYEILGIVQKLQQVQIIHGDIKPDNFLILSFPVINDNAQNPEEMFEASQATLQLIDYGRSIDMSAFPRGKTFREVFKTEALKTPQMRENRPWSYELDYVGIASTAHVLLLESYMKLGKKGSDEGSSSHYAPQAQFKRWHDIPFWNDFFYAFLNIATTNGEAQLPDLSHWQARVAKVIFEKKLRNFNDVLSNMTQAMKR